MKVYTLDIDSGDRDPTAHPTSNSFVVDLKTPIYNVTHLDVVSARVPRPKVFHDSNNKFTVEDHQGTYDITIDPTSGNLDTLTNLASELQTLIGNAGCDTVDQVADSGGKLVFSNVGATHEFSLNFNTGVDGWSSNVWERTTPNQIFGFNASDVTSSGGTLTSGTPEIFHAPKTFVLKVSSGSDPFNQDVYAHSPYYTGVFMNNDVDTTSSAKQPFYVFYGNDDALTHEFTTGPQREVKSLKFEWLYKENNKLVPLDFDERDVAVKLRIKGSTDKLEGLPKVEAPESIGALPPPISIPNWKENVYEWDWDKYVPIVFTVFAGLIVLWALSGRSRRAVASAS
jgi:hypothetical protein